LKRACLRELSKSKCKLENSSAFFRFSGARKIMATRLLFVDDDPKIRETLSQILTMHSFEVACAATVAEALAIITSRPFDVLISDLNIGQPGDGFTVVSAMRRTQPDCLNFILTGYPAFESALQAIRSQVDDYLVKPAKIPELIAAIEQRLSASNREALRPAASKRVFEIIREQIRDIAQRLLAAMKAEPGLKALPLSDEQRVYLLEPMLLELANILESSTSGRVNRTMFRSAMLSGRLWQLQGYSIPLTIAAVRLLENVLYELVAENLLSLEISDVIPDIRRLSNGLGLLLEEQVRAYLEARERRLVFDSSAQWSGWFCERCCWHRRAPEKDTERIAFAASVDAEFNAHNCEEFARSNWQLLDAES
jgi:ActR/RegA family two-component response regulator